MRLLFIILISALTTKVTAEPRLQDYARGVQLLIKEEAAIYRVPLPMEVYQTVYRRDMGDIRVFNGNGEIVPHALQGPKIQEITASTTQPLAIFPIPDDAQELLNLADLNIQINDSGSIIRLERNVSTLNTQDLVNTWVIDLSTVKNVIDELVFELSANAAGYKIRATLQGSEDLNSWSNLVAEFALLDLTYSNYNLKKNSVALPYKPPKYLRLKFLENTNGANLVGVTARFNSVTSVEPRQWLEILHSYVDEDRKIFRFDTAGNFPVDRFNLILPEINTVAEATVLTSQNEQDSPVRRYSGMFYSLQISGSPLTNDAVSLRPLTDRHWRLEITNPADLGMQDPVLNIGWIPDELYFLARGAGPFTLAFGNSEAEKLDRPITALMSTVGDEYQTALIQAASLGDYISLRGNDALTPVVVIPWQRIFLWGTLVLGVFIVGFMAVRLYRQIGHS